MTGRAGSFRIEAYLDEEQEKVARALERALERFLPLLSPSVGAPLTDVVLADGKRLRPILCIAAFRACHGKRGDPVPIYDLAASLEMIHAYSLMHDDLPCMDDAPLRRGLPTPHTIHGEPTTMRAGVALIPLAGLQAWEAAGRLGLASADRRTLVRTLTRAAGAEGMVGGQALDLLAEGRELSKNDLDSLHRMKTGALLAASVRLGALAARARATAVAALGEYGRSIGLAFQIADDLLDATADVKILGKNPSDKELDKSTYVRFLGVEAARDEAERIVRSGLAALQEAGIDSVELVALARYATRRDR